MEIIREIKINLEDTELAALQTLKDAYSQCVINDWYDCDECPLYIANGCIGMYAEKALEKQEKR